MCSHLPPHCMEPARFSARLRHPAIAIGLPRVSHMHAAAVLHAPCAPTQPSQTRQGGLHLISGEPSVHSYFATFGLQRGLGLIFSGFSVDECGSRDP